MSPVFGCAGVYVRGRKGRPCSCLSLTLVDMLILTRHVVSLEAGSRIVLLL